MDPCFELKKIFDHPATKSKIQELRLEASDNTNDPDREKGFELKFNSNNELSSNPIRQGEQDYEFAYNFYENEIGGVHMHPFGAFPMFSPHDISTLNTFWNSFSGSSFHKKFVHILVSKNGVHAIKINNPTKFMAYNIATSTRESRDLINDYFSSVYDKKINYTTGEMDNSSEFEEAFLEFINLVDNGITVYRANSNYTNWTELKLDSNGEVDDSSDCPQ